MIWQQNSKALLQRKGLWQIINPGVANDTTENGIKCIGYIKKDLDECGMDLIHHVDTPLEAWILLQDNFQVTHGPNKELYEGQLQRFEWDGDGLESNHARFLTLRRLYIGSGGTQTANTYGSYFLRGMNISEVEANKETMIGMNKTLAEIMVRCRVVLSQKLIGKQCDSIVYTARTKYVEDNNQECYKCHETGHSAKDCQNTQKCDKCRRSGHDTSNCRAHLKCDFCGRTGHEVSTCNFKKKYEAKNGKIEQAAVAKIEERFLMVNLNQSIKKSIKNEKEDNWIMDSGATSHVYAGSKEKMKNYRSINNMSVNSASGHKSKVCGKGDIKVENVTLKNVLHVPDFEDNLISLSVVERNGSVVVLDKGRCRIYQDNQMIMEGYRAGNLYKIQSEECDFVNNEQANLCNANISEWSLWHNRMGHVGNEKLNELFKLWNFTPGQDEECISCLVGKQTANYKKSKAKESHYEFGEMLHVDLCGPMETASKSGARYGMPLVEDKEGLIIGHVLKKKSDAEENIRHTILWMEKQFNINVKILRADRGGEFVSNNFKNWCLEKGIEQQFSHTGESKENGVAERAHRTLMNSVRTMLDASGLDESYWAEAFKFSVCNQNAVMHKRTGNIPYYAAYEEYPDWNKFRPFGCLVTYLDRKSGKLGKRGRRGIMIGYNSSNTKGYRILDLETNKITTSANVKFFENNYPMKIYDTKFEIHQDVPQDEEDSEDSDDTEITNNNNTLTSGTNTHNNVTTPLTNTINVTPHTTFPSRAQTRSMTSARLQDASAQMNMDRILGEYNITKVHTESVATLLKEDEGKWKDAMDQEIAQLASKETFTEVDKEPYMKVIGTQWIMATKYTADGNLIKFDQESY